MGIAERVRQADARIRGRKSGGPPEFSSFARSGAYGRYGNDTGMHQEQYSHFAGYVYSIIRTIANRITGQPVRHARRVKEGSSSSKNFAIPNKHLLPSHLKGNEQNLRLLTDSPILQAFRDPNPIMVRNTLMVNTIASLELTGKAFWWMRFDEETDRPEIWPIPAHWMEPIHTTKLFSGWYVSPGGGAERFQLKARDVVYFYYPDPSDPMGAYAPLTALARTVMADESVEEAQRRSFLNTMNPGLAITIGGDPEDSGTGQAQAPVMTRDQRKALKAIMKEEYRGTVNFGEPMILDGFIKGVAPIFPNPKELDFLNSSMATKSRLAQGWGVNPISMGEVEGANRASSAVADDHLINNVVNPRIALMSEVMTCWMPRFFTKRRDEVVYLEPAASKDIEWELQRDMAMFDRGAKSVNEWRDGHGMTRLVDGDRAYIPPTQDSGGWEDVEVDDTPESGNSGSADIKRKPKVIKKISGLIDGLADDVGFQIPKGTKAAKLGVSGLADHWQKENDRHRKAIAEVMAEVLMGLGRHAVNAIGKYRGHGVSSAVSHAINAEKWKEGMTSAVRESVTEAAVSGATGEWILNIRGKIKSSLPGRVSRLVASQIDKLLTGSNWGKWVRGITEAVRKAIMRAETKNADPVEAAKSILTEPTAVAAVAARIADAEATAAVESGRHATFKVLASSGRVVGRKWYTCRDGRVRDAHRKAHGQVVRGDAPFIVGGEQCKFPGDPELSPGNRVNCRCVSISIG